MNAQTSADAARAVSANDLPVFGALAFVPVVELSSFDRLGAREIDGSYPFRSHRTVAEVWAAEGVR